MGLSAQENRFVVEHFTYEQGLPNNIVFGITQDSAGYIWLATDNGLVRYNGRNFTIFNTEDNLPGNSITAVTPFGKEGVVAACFNRGFVFMKGTQVIDTLMQPLSVQYISITGKDVFIEARYNTYSLKNRKISLFTKVAAESCRELKQYEDNTYILFTKEHYAYLDKIIYPNIRQQIFKIDITNLQIPKYFQCFSMQKDGTFWLGGSDNLLLHLDNVGNVLEKVSLPTKDKYWVHRLLSDSQGRLWISQSGGNLFLYEKGKIQQINDLLGIHKAEASSLFESKDKSIWFGTYGAGLIRLTDAKIQTFSEEEGGEKAAFRAVKTTEGKIFANTNTSFFIFDKNGLLQKKKMPILSEKIKIKGKDIYYNGQLKDYPVQTEYGLRFWNVFGLVEFEPMQDSFVAAYNSNNGSIIMGKVPFLDYSSSPAIFKLPPKCSKVRQIFYHKKRLYLATVNGLLQINLKGNLLQEDLKGKQVNCLFLDDKGKVWVGTEDKLYCENEKGAFIVQKMKHQLRIKPNSIYAILQSDKNTYWLGTLNGLYQYFPASQNYNRISPKMGLPDMHIHALTYYKEDSTLWIATNQGLAKLKTTNFLIQEQEIALSVSRFKVNSKDSIFAQNMRLGYQQNNLSFEIDFPLFQSDAYQIRYIINQRDTFLTLDNHIDLFLLKPDNYSIRVEIFGTSNTSISLPFEIKFQINAPFWQKTWFVLLMLVLLSGGIYGIFHFRNKQKNEFKMLENQLIKYEQQALSSMMNPHFIFNALNSIQSFINTNDRIQAKKYLSDFSKLIRLNLDLVRQGTVPLHKEMEMLRIYGRLEQMRLQERVEIIIPPENEEEEWGLVMIPALMLQPYLENAIWHGAAKRAEGGKTWIEILQGEDEAVHILICDNGLGKKSNVSNSAHKSHGADITLQRIKTFQQMTKRRFEFKEYPLYPNEEFTGWVVEIVVS